jgi:hypothetical protein
LQLTKSTPPEIPKLGESTNPFGVPFNISAGKPWLSNAFESQAHNTEGEAAIFFNGRQQGGIKIACRLLRVAPSSLEQRQKSARRFESVWGTNTYRLREKLRKFERQPVRE